MKLFDEMEKCFPEMEKHYKKAFYAEDWLLFWGLSSNREDFFYWTLNRFCREENSMTALFREVGVYDSAVMTNELIRWFLYDLCSKDPVIRADISLVRRSAYQSLRQVP